MSAIATAPEGRAMSAADGRDASAWTVADLECDTGWFRPLDDAARAYLMALNKLEARGARVHPQRAAE